MNGITIFTLLYIAFTVYIYNVYALFYRYGIVSKIK